MKSYTHMRLTATTIRSDVDYYVRESFLAITQCFDAKLGVFPPWQIQILSGNHCREGGRGKKKKRRRWPFLSPAPPLPHLLAASAGLRRREWDRETHTPSGLLRTGTLPSLQSLVSVFSSQHVSPSLAAYIISFLILFPIFSLIMFFLPPASGLLPLTPGVYSHVSPLPCIPPAPRCPFNCLASCLSVPRPLIMFDYPVQKSTVNIRYWALIWCCQLLPARDL